MEVRISGEEPGRFRAQGAFTDRESESEAFRHAVLAHEENVHNQVLGYGRPRRNVLTYYGIGGIGKTVLSETLQSWLHDSQTPEGWGPAPVIDRPVRSVRMDLNSSEGLDVERLLLMMRAELGDTGLRFDALDVGLGLFWDSAHPGQDFPALRPSRPGGALVADQLQDSFGAILKEIGLEGFGVAGGVARGTRATLKVIAARHAASRGARCPDLVSVAEATRSGDLTRDDAVQLAPLLHWDLGQVGATARVQLMVFVDTYERAQAEGSRGDRLLRILAYYLPEVLFVFTGRNRLRWHEDTDDHAPESVGPDCWPGLVEGSPEQPRQHLVGELSASDANAFLSGFVTDEGRALLSDEVKDHVVEASAGLPLFLDLAIDRAVDLHVRGEPIDVSSFARSRDGVVRSVLRDLDEDNRNLLRFAVLLPSWDLDLLREATRLPGGLIRRNFIRRAFVHEDPASGLPYRIHDVIRESILAEDAPDDWDRDDWRAARERAAAILRARIDTADDPYEEAALIKSAIEVCSRLDADADWLRLSAFRFRSLRELAATLPPPTPGPRTYAALLHRVLWCYALPRAQVHVALRELAETEPLPPTLEGAAWRHYAYRLRGQGDYTGALAIFRDLATRFPEQRDLHTHQIGVTLTSMGRLADAWDVVAEVSDERRVGIEAGIMRWHGELEEAVALLARRSEHLRSLGDERVSGELGRLEAFCRALLDPSAAPMADERRREADEMGNAAAIVSAISAQMVARAGDEEAVGRLAAEADQVAEAGGLEFGTRRLVALAFHHAVQEDANGVSSALDRLNGLTSEGALHLYRRIVEFWRDALTGESSANTRQIQWWEDEDSVRLRWVAIIERRRDTIGSRPAQESQH